MMSAKDENLKNREWLKNRIKSEIIGPDSFSKENAVIIDPSENILIDKETLYKPKVQSNGEEVLWQDSPLKRYGAGILYPQEITDNIELETESDSALDLEDNSIDDARIDEKAEEAVKKRGSTSIGADDSDDFDVSLANSHKPSALGISFIVSPEELDHLYIEISLAIYKKLKANVKEFQEQDRKYVPSLWFRVPVKDQHGELIKLKISRSEIINSTSPLKKPLPGLEKMLELVIIARKYSSDRYLLTVSLVNIITYSDTNSLDELCFYQCGFNVTTDPLTPSIKAYPDYHQERDYDDETEINRLLYRDKNTFAVGHGCAAVWEKGAIDGVNRVTTETLPEYETPSVSADLFDNGVSLRVSMKKLAGLDPSDDGQNDVKRLVDAYETWIKSLSDYDNRKTAEGVAIPIPTDLSNTADLLVSRCNNCLARIRSGIALLQEKSETGDKARLAFRLTNYAMLLSQIRQSRITRNPIISKGEGMVEWDIPFSKVDISSTGNRGYWRPFQIAFLLMTIRGIVEPDNSTERELVDLIWFPTGGGKTEAYLGLTAFTIFYNRLTGRVASGADVIMRYTLRLLTAQQFQRAATLFCSMEYLRLQEFRAELGDHRFSLGMWVGGEATPNKRADARTKLKRLLNPSRYPNADNPFVLLKCPWCNAKMGPRDSGVTGGKEVYGYKKKKSSSGEQTVVFQCEDHRCDFSHDPRRSNNITLPISVIDEDILDDPPNLIIGTVDKFAMLAWDPKIRSIFGLDNDGVHEGLPPSLIIQDELHLISGPLGSMVGAYESVIEELCVDNSTDQPVRPKIIASTATISRANEQVKSLYARKNVMLFPPSGLEASNSFFSKESRDSENRLEPGRLYLGIMAPGHGSLQTTQARVYATLLHAAASMDVDSVEKRDPWWTLLAFFNSLRELGGANTLFSSDVRDYLKVLNNRFQNGNVRYINTLLELTSRMRGDQIPQYIKLLEKTLELNSKGKFSEAVDVCLSSSIIEVGVDIDRLSLMAIVGQPKTTSQYIQVSSRVGRNLDAPGMVLTLFSPGKPRDRSHYEKFTSYHQSLYAQVEPTSVTPFSPPAVDRALHGIMVAAVRQLSPIDSVISDARPFPLADGTPLRKHLEEIIERRVSIVDPSERPYVQKIFKKRLNQWHKWDPAKYGGFGKAQEDAPLLHPAGSYVPYGWNNLSWATMSSLRSVDASCEADITTAYNEVIEE